MRYRIQVALKTSNLTRALTQRDWLTSYLDGRGALVEVGPIAYEGADGWCAYCDVTFGSDAEAEAMLAEIQARWATVTQIQAGSLVQKHACPHDEPDPPACVVEKLVVK
jgi:hypothetical protein